MCRGHLTTFSNVYPMIAVDVEGLIISQSRDLHLSMGAEGAGLQDTLTPSLQHLSMGAGD